MGHLRGTEKGLSKDPVRADTYNQEIRKLLDAGYVTKLTSDEVQASVSSWYIPHHVVHHNGKDQIVFNCSFTYQGASLNEHHSPGPAFGSTLLAMLLSFRKYTIAVSSDISIHPSIHPSIHLLPLIQYRVAGAAV